MIEGTPITAPLGLWLGSVTLLLLPGDDGDGSDGDGDGDGDG